MPNLLVIAHAPLASALRQVAEHIYPDCVPTLAVLVRDLIARGGFSPPPQFFQAGMIHGWYAARAAGAV